MTIEKLIIVYQEPVGKRARAGEIVRRGESQAYRDRKVEIKAGLEVNPQVNQAVMKLLKANLKPHERETHFYVTAEFDHVGERFFKTIVSRQSIPSSGLRH